MKTRLTLLLVCLVFAGLRFVLPVQGINRKGIYKALAHVYVGGLFGAAIATGEWELWAMAGGLTACEVVAALTRG